MKTYTVLTSKFADEDLRKSEDFYELQAENLGVYFFDTLIADIESLSFYGGIHVKHFGFYRMLAKRFPYAIYYYIKDDLVIVIGVLDLRSKPSTNYKKLQDRV
jgi:hypothetical protein